MVFDVMINVLVGSERIGVSNYQWQRIRAEDA